MNLVIVESPAKSKTLKKFLGDDFEIMASYGHVRDLISKKDAVDTAHDFQMSYAILDKSKAQINKITSALKNADTLYLATDPDREGEAISWHLHEILKQKKALDGKNVHRIVFHEITRRAVTDAIKNPRGLSNNLINAQQTRRALDYLVGFNLSPLLWRKIKGGLSAGRVQSPALRLIVEREQEIEAFKTREYWTIDTTIKQENTLFPARLFAMSSGKAEQFNITTKEKRGETDWHKIAQFDIHHQKQAEGIRDDLIENTTAGMHVAKVEKKQKHRNPAPPFITSTLQQESVRKLGLSASRTMRIAQQLYEGINLGSGPVGLISYMRTDSVTLSTEALRDIRAYIADTYGEKSLPDKARVFKTKSKNAQEAHEAIRPTSISITPQQARVHLDDTQFRLYQLIWQRAVACQMIHATLDTVSINIQSGDYLLRASGSTIKDPGFMQIYTEGYDERKEQADKQNDIKIPSLQQGDTLQLEKINACQHFTEPPPRYSEASLIKTLEEYGIGRPSTYASIISTLQGREYVELVKKRFIPTDVGSVVTRFLTEHFTQYVEYEFTANLEDELDEVSRGERDWTHVLKDFWEPFKVLIEDKTHNISRADVIQPRELGHDPKTLKPISVKLGRYGPYVQMGTREDEEKPRFAGLKPGQKMDALTLEEALKLFDLPRHLGETPEGEIVETNIGRFGPYVKYGSKYASLKGDSPYEIELDRALEIITAKKKSDVEKIIKIFESEGIQILKGRWGPYVTDGTKSVRLANNVDPDTITITEYQSMLEAAPAKKGRVKKKTKKKNTRKKT